MSNQLILQHLEQRLDLIQRKVCELYEQRDAIRAELKHYGEELGQLKAERQAIQRQQGDKDNV